MHKTWLQTTERLGKLKYQVTSEMNRILIIGGTGMLREATEYFILNNFRVSIIGRDVKKLNYFTDKFPDKKTINLISQDYRDTKNFIKVIKKNIKLHGSFDIIISWIHSNANNSLLQLIDTLVKYNKTTIFYHIKGSASSTTSNTTTKCDLFNTRLDYREIFLGFKIDNNSSRWLTNTEISNGIIDAVNSNILKCIVGQTEPIDLRP